MKRCLAVLVLAAFCTGCIALQRTPEATVLHSLRTIAVIPMEASGPATPPPPGGSGGGLCCVGALGPGAGPVVAVVAAGLLVYGIYRLADAANNPAPPLPEGTLTVERERQAGGGMLTVDLAKAAAEALQRSAGRTVYLVDGYVRVPGVAQAPSPYEAELQMNKWILHWYGEDVTSTDYSGLTLEGVDAILEVGLYLYGSTVQDTLTGLGVMVRLVDPATKRVLGRAKDWLPLFFRTRKPGSVEQQARAWGQELVTRCLKDMDLLGD